jgi:hypothetical protein
MQGKAWRERLRGEVELRFDWRTNALSEQELEPHRRSSLQGTCGICHDTANVANHSLPTPLNIGTGDLSPTTPPPTWQARI